MSSHFISIAELKFAVQLRYFARAFEKAQAQQKKRLVELHLKEGKVAKTS